MSPRPLSLQRTHSLTALALAALVAACGGGGGAKTDDRPMLEKLGVPTHLPPRADAATLHPLRRNHTIYQRRTELYVSGIRTTDPAHFSGVYLGKRQVLLDDGKAASGGGIAYGPIFTDTAYEGWTVHNSASCGADLDGDGREEVVVLYQNRTVTPMKGFLRVIRRSGAGYVQSAEYELPGDFTFNQALGPYDGLQVAAGDLDGDGKDEVALVAGDRVLVVRWVPDQFLAVADHAYRPGETRAQITSAAIGNVDADPELELVVVNGIYSTSDQATAYVYAWSNGQLVEASGGLGFTPKEAADAPGGARNYGYARVAIGDLDGDHFEEIALVGESIPYSSTLAVTVVGFSPQANALLPQTTTRYGMGGGDWEAQWLPVAAVFDADGPSGGSGKELLAYRWILHLDDDGKLAHKWANLVLPVAYYDKVTTGDFNGDGREDVAFVSNDQWIRIFGYADGSFHGLKTIDVDADGHHTTLTGVDIDDDSTVLEYTGDYELLYSEPQLLAVLASPPYYAGQDTAGAATSFEWEASSEDESGETYGFYAGVSVGYHAETPFWGSAGSSEFKLNVDTSMDWNFTTGNEQSAAREFNCGAGQNQVVFVSTPVDVYHYEIVASPDPAQLHSVVTVQVPRTPRIMPMDVELYNQAVPEELRVPAGILEHEMGDPWSYPTRADMLALFSDGPIRHDETHGDYHTVIPVAATQGGFRTPDPFRITVGYANDTQAITLSRGASQGYGTEFNLEVGVEFENVSGGVLVGGRAGFHYGYSHSYRTTERTTIRGAIPNISPGKKIYTAGLFAYPYPVGAKARFVVVNYWVED